MCHIPVVIHSNIGTATARASGALCSCWANRQAAMLKLNSTAATASQ